MEFYTDGRQAKYKDPGKLIRSKIPKRKAKSSRYGRPQNQVRSRISDDKEISGKIRV